MFYIKNPEGQELPVWPVNNGAIWGSAKKTVLKAGSLIVDRYGRKKGSFVAPEGTSLEERALPRSTDPKTVHRFRVIKDVVVEEGITAPWFCKKGGGLQYRAGKSLTDMPEYFESC